MQFTIDITDPDHLAGITAAREAYNADPNNAVIESDAEYYVMRCRDLPAAWAQQHLSAASKIIADVKAAGVTLDAAQEAALREKLAPKPVREEKPKALGFPDGTAPAPVVRAGIDAGDMR